MRRGFSKSIAARLALVAAMFVMLSVPALANTLPPATGNLTIHKIVGGGTAEGNGTELSTPPAGTPATGVVFRLYKVNTTSGIPAAGMTYELSGSNMLVKNSSGAQVGSYPVTSAGTITTGAGGIGTASNLSQGVYLVVEDLDASTITGPDGLPLTVNTPCANFIVAVPMTNPAGDGWLTTVHVYPKNQAFGVVKTTPLNPANAVAVGDVVPYVITAGVPGDILDSKRFNIIDDLDDALTLQAASVVVKALPSNATLTAGTDYNVDYNTATNVFTVSFTQAGRDGLDGLASVQVSFNTVVNNKLYDKLTNNDIPNQASVSYQNGLDRDFEANTNGEGPTLHTASIEVTKLAAGSNQALPGATFRIATSQANALAGNCLRIASDGKLLNVGDAGYSSAPYFECSPNNVGRFVGLRDKVDDEWQTYYLVESKAPTGYNLLSTPTAVTFNGSEVNYNKTVSVYNAMGFTLPVTGGLGTVIFTSAGIILLGLAVMVALASRRRRRLDR